MVYWEGWEDREPTEYVLCRSIVEEFDDLTDFENGEQDDSKCSPKEEGQDGRPLCIFVASFHHHL